MELLGIHPSNRRLQTLKDLLLWVEEDLGPWGPVALAFAYVPLTILVVPASVLTVCREDKENMVVHLLR